MKTIQKGEKISLDKELGTRDFLVAITWDQSNHPDYEVDASVMLLSERGKLEEESDFVFYNNPNSLNNEISLLNEKISGYQKVFNLSLNKSSNNISKMMFLLTIEDGDSLNRRLGDLKNIKIDILDKNNKSVLISYQITDLTKETALILADIYKRNDEWRIQPRGEGFNSGLAAIIKEYGSEKVQVADEEVKVEPKKET
ncbi:MAG: TerD family protein, partial [Candidatus Sericytochromatia bacterium]